jgi:hypothetical protein
VEACPAKSSALRWPRSSGAAQNGKRRSIGSQGCAHLGWRLTGCAGFREEAADCGVLEAAGGAVSYTGGVPTEAAGVTTRLGRTSTGGRPL